MPDLNPVAHTAFYCCALRAADAARPNPVCGDTFAARFLDDEIRRDLVPLLRLHNPAASNVARHRLIDDLVREALALDSARRILLLGAGFDTRAFRLPGGQWWEFDDPQLLAFKEARLPASTAPNSLTRVPVVFATEPIGRHLAPLAGTDNALVILEGVTMYLTDWVLQDLAASVRATLPCATLICDLMSPAFARSYGRKIRAQLTRLGAQFADRSTHPRHAIEAAGWVPSGVASIMDRARQAGTVAFPRWLLATLLRELRDGYAVWTFAPTA